MSCGRPSLIPRLEAYLTIRGQEYLASLGQAPSVINGHIDGVAASDVRKAFGPGAGMNDGTATPPATNAAVVGNGGSVQKSGGWGRKR